MIHINDMYKIYRMGAIDINALNGVSIKIEQHEFVAIVGPSGSGKSTLMNMIGCLDTPTSGACFIDGVKVNGLNDSQLADIRNQKIGFIFQGFNLLHKLSAIENVELPLIYQGVSAKERYERSITALKEVGLEDRIHHKPSELSGGQQQRVAIARAVVANPKLILADEPTGNLDSANGDEVMKLLTELNKEGTTIVMVTHSPSDAEFAHRIVQLFDGHIVTENIKKLL